MSVTMQRVKTLLQQHGEDVPQRLFVGELADSPPSADVFAFDEFLTTAPSDLRRTLGVCINPGVKNNHVIARLRDVHCDRVLLIQTDAAMPATELLALGFQELATEDDCTVFLHSAEGSLVRSLWSIEQCR